ncbi:MAG: ribosome biogenesis GTPase Der [Candidatus Peregrinibacteria bacterium]
MKTPIVTIVGRPNTGKSTLFNRLAGKRIAITSEEAGTTRDRLFYKVETGEMDFFIVDTGGLEFGKSANTIENDMKLQAEVAIEEADLILFLVEGKGDLKTQDLQVARLLRKSTQKPILLIASKCEQTPAEEGLAHLYKLGLGDPIPTDALNKIGTDDLIQKIIKVLKEKSFLTKSSSAYKNAEEQEKTCLQIAMVGKPNVGKSSLINALLKKEKLIVSPTPGTTRDTTDNLIKYQGKTYNLIDTAGLRRQSKREQGIEHYSALRSMAAIDRSDIVLLVLDSNEKLSQQDQQIGSYILIAGKGLIILANKWDIKNSETEASSEQSPEEGERRARFIYRLQQKFSFTPWAPLIFTSATTKKNLNRIFEQIETVKKESEKRIQTRELNNFVQKITWSHKPAGTKHIPPKLFYMTQTGINPPHFVAFVNKKKYFHFSYLRYLENRLREKFGFTGTPLKIEYREKEQRYKRK